MAGWRLGVTAAAVWMAGAGLASACTEEGALFFDPFDNVQKSVWKYDGVPSVFEGHMVLRPNVGKTNTIYTVDTFDDVAICAELRLIYSRDLPASYTGIAFWVSDLKNLYVFQITLNGYAGAYRLKDNEWSTVLKDQKLDFIDTERMAFNEVRVVTKGDAAELFVNGHKIGDITGEPPEESHIGYMVQSPNNARATYELDAIAVHAAE